MPFLNMAPYFEGSQEQSNVGDQKACQGALKECNAKVVGDLSPTRHVLLPGIVLILIKCNVCSRRL